MSRFDRMGKSSPQPQDPNRDQGRMNDPERSDDVGSGIDPVSMEAMDEVQGIKPEDLKMPDWVSDRITKALDAEQAKRTATGATRSVMDKVSDAGQGLTSHLGLGGIGGLVDRAKDLVDDRNAADDMRLGAGTGVAMSEGVGEGLNSSRGLDLESKLGHEAESNKLDDGPVKENWDRMIAKPKDDKGLDGLEF